MMTKTAFLALGLPVLESDQLYVESGLEWLQNNTTLKFTVEDVDSLKNLPSAAKLFLAKFCEVAKRDVTLASETVGPLSKSYANTGYDRQVFLLARQLLRAYLLPSVQFIPCERRWR